MESFAEVLNGRSLVFLVGVFRSGTSLLHRLVNAHPKVSLMWEADCLRFLASKATRNWPERLDLWNGCITRHRIEPALLPRDTTREEAAVALYSAHAASPETLVIGEKSPYYADILPRIARNFPLARFLIIHREPAAVVASVRQAALGNRFFRAPWMPLRVMKDAGRLRRDACRLRAGGHSVFDLDFEQLVKDPSGRVGEIWQYLGLDAEPIRESPTKEDLMPPGEHHRLARMSAVDPERALPDDHETGDQWQSRLQNLNGHIAPECGDSLRFGIRSARDEAFYHIARAAECGRRIAFRNAPIQMLRNHRVRSNHEVA